MKKIGGKVHDLTGQRFGRLVVEEFTGLDKRHQAWWKCICDCGKGTIIRAHSLKQRDTKSCGCLIRELAVKKRTKPKGEAAFNTLYSKYRRNGRERNLEFNLIKSVFRILVTCNCHYCGIEPTQILHPHRGNGDFIYNGIDRVDNSRGYTVENCVPCCKTCNSMKAAQSDKDFKSHILKIAQHIGEKKEGKNGEGKGAEGNGTKS